MPYLAPDSTSQCDQSTASASVSPAPTSPDRAVSSSEVQMAAPESPHSSQGSDSIESGLEEAAEGTRVTCQVQKYLRPSCLLLKPHTRTSLM